MDIELFNEFLVLAQTLNYSKAAQQLYLSQSVLSRHIQNLENHLGVALLSRNKHSVELTAIGEIFAKDAQNIVTDYQTSLKHIQMAKDGNIGHLELYSCASLSNFFMYDFLLGFSKKYPYIQVHTTLIPSNDRGIANAASGEADVSILLNWTEQELNGLSRHFFFREYLYLIVSENNELAKKETVSIHELSKLPMIYFGKDENNLAYTYFSELFVRHQAVYNPSILVNNLVSLFFKVLSGEGVSIISKQVLHSLPAGIHSIRISDEDAYRDVLVVWRPDSSNPSLPIFINEFSKFSKKYALHHPLDLKEPE